MPLPKKSLILQLWSFFKESYLNVEVIGKYMRRNKLTVLLMVTNLVLFVLVMFITEQTMQKQKKLAEARLEQKELMDSNNRLSDENLKYQECDVQRKHMTGELATVRNQLSLAQSDYRELNKVLTSCQSMQPVKNNPPQPKPYPKPVPLTGPEPPRGKAKSRDHQTALDDID